MIRFFKDLTRGFYYKRIFIRNRKKIRKLFSILQDDISVSVVKLILSGYMAVFREQTYYFSKASVSPCTEYHFTTDNGYKVLGTVNPYFLPDIFSFDHLDSYLDGGAYVGDTIVLLNELLNEYCKNIYAFEPNPETFIELCHTVKKYGDTVTCYQCGLDDHDGIRSFTCKDSASQIDSSGNTRIKVIDTARFLDEIPCKPQLIKLDIEGNERTVIRSMERFIKKYKPDLAISIYHSLEDIWDLPIMLKSFCPDYKLYIRHQSNFFTETICYATAK